MKKIVKKNKKKTVYISLSFLLLIVTGVMTMKYMDYSKDKIMSASDTESKIEEKKVKSLVEESKQSDLILAGKITANNTTKIKINPERGSIKEILVKEGDRIEKGQPLFTYQTEQQMKTKEAELDAEAKARAVELIKNTSQVKWGTYNKKVTQLNQAKANYKQENTEELKNEIKTLEDAVDQAYTEGLNGDNEVKTAENELERANLMKILEQEKLKLDTILADSAGTVKSLNKELIDQSQDKQKKENFIEIVDDSTLFVNGEVNEFDREKISLNQTVEVIDRKNKEKKWQGKVVQIAYLSSENTGSDKKQDEDPNASKFPFKVRLDTADQLPNLDSHVYVKILPEYYDSKKIILNKKYIFTQNDKQYVWKVENNKINRQEIKAISIGESFFEVNEGVTQEDTIAVPKKGMEAGMEVGEDVKS